MAGGSTRGPIPAWVSFFGSVAPAASIVVYLAPVPTILKIQRDRSVGSFPLLPYSSMVASSFLWLTYGVLKNEPKIYGANLFGFVCGCYYSWSFLRFSPKASPTLPGAVAHHAKGCLAIVVLTAMLAASEKRFPAAREWIGRAGVVFCLALFASPLASLRTVIETRSAASIPAPFTVACIVNCFAWTVWGWFAMSDPNIYAPNGLGLAFGLVQLALKFLYPGGGGNGIGSRHGTSSSGSGIHLELAGLLPK
jgi:solute carrier family 50 protein (sugar transporter)